MYSIGVDFGSLSGRALLVDLTTGRERAVSIKNYAHGVMSERIPDGTPLGSDFALQHPADYLDVLKVTIPDVLKKSGVSAAEVVGIGIDFTACTVLPVKKDGTPLCFDKAFSSRPHAYVKLWKHHAAQAQATRINALAADRGEAWLARYGGKISSEWLFPKLLQVFEEAPEVYAATDKFIEATDFIVWQLCGSERRSSCTAGYKAIWSKTTGYPSPDFFAALNPGFMHAVKDKLSEDIYPIGTRAGFLTAAAAALTGLKVGTAVAVGNVDAHVTLPALGITDSKKMLMIMGTSTCHVLCGDSEKNVPGMCGVALDGIIGGLYGYEAGQSCVGDHFDWFVKNCVPPVYFKTTEETGEDIHTYLSRLASRQSVGESGLLALDWWNGNRCVLADADLSGVILGMTLLTKPEQIYRALIEATAFGTRMIIETFRKNGVPVEELYAAGGIAEKNKLMMQIYADVTNMQIRIGGSPQAPALGSAIFGAVAAGAKAGGFDTVRQAAAVMAKLSPDTYTPIAKNTERYDKIYEEYRRLHDYFGRGENDCLKRLKAIKADAVKG